MPVSAAGLDGDRGGGWLRGPSDRLSAATGSSGGRSAAGGDSASPSGAGGSAMATGAGAASSRGRAASGSASASASGTDAGGGSSWNSTGAAATARAAAGARVSTWGGGPGSGGTGAGSGTCGSGEGSGAAAAGGESSCSSRWRSTALSMRPAPSSGKPLTNSSSPSFSPPSRSPRNFRYSGLPARAPGLRSTTSTGPPTSRPRGASMAAARAVAGCSSTAASIGRAGIWAPAAITWSSARPRRVTRPWASMEARSPVSTRSPSPSPDTSGPRADRRPMAAPSCGRGRPSASCSSSSTPNSGRSPAAPRPTAATPATSAAPQADQTSTPRLSRQARTRLGGHGAPMATSRLRPLGRRFSAWN